MSQRQCAKTQGVSLKVAWQGIAWKKVQRHVFRLQKRIDRAAQREDVRTVHKLQKLLVKSWYARLLVAYPRVADNVSRPLPYRLSAVNQPVISPLNRFSTSCPPLL